MERRENPERHINICSTDFQQRCQSNTVITEYFFQQMILEQLFIHMEEK